MMEEVILYENAKEEVVSCYTSNEVTPLKKRKSKEDSVAKPKKPRSAYLLYYFDVHQRMQPQIHNLPQSEINKRISESWKRLSVAEKGYYLEKAKLEKEGIETFSLSPSQNLPGFRKILPRGSYVLLSKECSSNNHPEAPQQEVSMNCVEHAGEGGLPFISLQQQTQSSPLVYATEVELAEQSIADDDVGENSGIVSHPATLQRILRSSHLAKASTSTVALTDGYSSQCSTDLGVDEASLRRSADCGFGVDEVIVSQIQEDTKVVAIIPSQISLLESKSFAGVSCVGPVVMVSVGASAQQNVKPSYKMESGKTYTRRGRGRCQTLGCSFVYVTRHKPPICPECGNHLGGKWIPVAKKKSKDVTKQLSQEVEIDSNKRCQLMSSPAKDGKSADCTTNTMKSKKDHQAQQPFRKHLASSIVRPPEGSINKPQEQTKHMNEMVKGATLQSQGKNNGVVQKRHVRPVLPAYFNTGRALLQFLTVPLDKRKFHSVSNNKSVTVARNLLSIKSSTLKQLSQTDPSTTNKQESILPASGTEPVSSGTDERGNNLSAEPFKQNTISKFDLGLSTARGKGRCKTPKCDYVYKNRHKPAVCPKCDCELTRKTVKGTKSTVLLDPYRALSVAQRDLQRQTTVQLLRHCLQIPENEADLQDILNLIKDLNSLPIVLLQPDDQEQEGGTVESGWPQFYESTATHCGLCRYPLFKGDQSTVAGQEDCWLLTESLIQTASLQLKVCLNPQCLALHSFTDLHTGLFNIGNKLLVSIDLFLRIRANIKLGFPPSQAVRTLLDYVPSHPVHELSPEESSQLQELLLSGYWAFECLTVRDYNDMICGICGVAPKLEIAQRDANNVLQLNNVEFTSPEFSVSDEVHVDDFWLTMESEALEQAAFPTDISITRVDASIIAPFIPPLMRSHVVINTEKDKVLLTTEQPSGDPSVLVRLIHDGQLRLDKVEEHSVEELRTMVETCGLSVISDSTKNDLLESLIFLYNLVRVGLTTASPPSPHLTAGKLSKICPHKVVCGSKYLVKRETARDHVDLLLSSRYWPPVYISDCARKVALCADIQYPELASQMWGRNQGCFSNPFENPEFVSCAELQDQPNSADMSLMEENQQVHPITKSSSCWMVHPPGVTPAQEHHSMVLCSELEPYVSLVAELDKEGEARVQHGEQCEGGDRDSTEKLEVFSSARHKLQQPMVFNNTAYYYLYNRLIDFLCSRDIVSHQINEVLKACQPGEVVIRDALYRLGVAQIKTEKEED
ncbi:HMG domain-containing protein 3 isoform X1 [Thalassophryne amazonica]|uniref:HMG domain-containing protein 3 isoform X1 n=1 Tax=Thalassophryne amazonica TaxID=390379 RepID=UPI0014708DBE|nr:HMG domain-containing protein 3 isoform X1 [Thalassophryne amazonica]